MDVFLKISGVILVTVILYLTVSKQNKDISMLITIAGTCLVLISAITFLNPIIDFVNKIKTAAGLDDDLISVILKAVGIGIITEITCLICTDSGNASLGKSMSILSSAVIIWMSLPIFEQLLELLDQVLGAI